MVLFGRALPAGCVGYLDLDADGIFRDHRALHLHGKADFAGLVLSDLNCELTVRPRLGTGDVQLYPGRPDTSSTNERSGPLFRIRTA